jgi:PAS domain S-box-containing protein
MRRDDPGLVAGRAGGGTTPPARPALLAPPTDILATGTADQLAALIARAVRAPTATVHIIRGDRLHLYGCHGLDIGRAEVAGTALERSLAGIVVTTDAPLVIEDVATDVRIPPDFPVLAGGPGAYLGCPVRDAAGATVGVCCAYDHRPRRWSADEISAVAEAAQVGALLVTEQLARQDLEGNRRFLDAVLDSLHDGVTACDADGRIVLINSRMKAMWGRAPVPADLADPATVTGLHHPDGRPLRRGDIALHRALRGERLRDEEVVLQGGGRKVRDYLVDAQPIAGPGGTVVGAVMAVQDVTRRRRAERFRTCELAVTTALAEAPTVQDAGPRVLEAVVGTLGWTHAELWLVDDAAHLLRPAARWSAPGWPADIDVPDRLPHGQGLAGRAWQAGKPLWIRDVGQPQSLISRETAITSSLHTALAIPVRNGADSLGVLTAFADTIEDPEDELVALMCGIAAHIGQFLERRLVEDLQRQLVRSKDEYLALIGHELRTPLTSISAYTELLRGADQQTLLTDGPLLLEVIDRNAAQLRQIIDELLELSALDTGHAAVQAAPVDLAAVVRGSVESARAAVSGNPVTLSAELPADLVLPGDERRLRQVVDNLLGNAVKYSPDGGQIDVRLRRVDGSAELTVSDTGIGISPEERQQMFSRLYRTTRARDRAIPGTGLGLALSRAVVQRHHGTIELADHDGPGTTIMVRLPLDAH